MEVPKEYRKIAQADTMAGEVLATAYYNPNDSTYFIKAQSKGDFLVLGPIPTHVFDNLASILADIKEMNRKYYYLE